jgi:hypothetical protein
VAIYATADPGTATIYLDNITACNSFSLVDLISKNSSASGGSEGWFPIQSIVGTTVLIDNDLSCLPTAGRGYYGTTATVATYRRTAFRISATASWVIQEGGSSTSVMMSYQGGYNTVSDTQDGETFMDGAGLGPIITLSTGSYHRLNRISFCRGTGAINSNTGTGFNEISCHNVCAMYAFFSTNGPRSYETYTITNYINNATGFTLLSTTYDCEFTFTNLNNNNSYGITCPGGGNRITFTNTCNNVNSGLYLSGNGDNTIIGSNSKYNTTYGIQIASGSVLPNRIFNITTSNNTTAGLYYAGLAGDYCKNLTLGEATPVSTSMSYFYVQPLIIEQYGGTVGNNRRYYYQANLFSQTATRHTASGIAWAAYILNGATRGYPFSALEVPVFRRFVDSGSAITVTCWVRRGESSYGVELICRGRQLAGVDSDVTDDISVGIDTWEQLSVTFTPSEVGVIEVSVLVWGGSASYAVFIDDVGVS